MCVYVGTLYYQDIFSPIYRYYPSLKSENQVYQGYSTYIMNLRSSRHQYH